MNKSIKSIALLTAFALTVGQVSAMDEFGPSFDFSDYSSTQETTQKTESKTEDSKFNKAKNYVSEKAGQFGSYVSEKGKAAGSFVTEKTQQGVEFVKANPQKAVGYGLTTTIALATLYFARKQAKAPKKEETTKVTKGNKEKTKTTDTTKGSKVSSDKFKQKETESSRAKALTNEENHSLKYLKGKFKNDLKKHEDVLNRDKATASQPYFEYLTRTIKTLKAKQTK